ncbi:MAG: YjgP/YjgQ family permease [Cytophagales bacterium]|nr:MAG: YjgP/YjgQ family permease [Cytophagales bacterium]
MKILDLYILKRFLTSFFFVVLLLLAIIVMIDYTEKNEDFIKSGLSFFEITKQFYIYFIPYIANTISPLIIFIAAVFVTSRMSSHTEIIAILNSGVSFRRFLFPFFVGSSIIAIATFFLIGWVIPKSNKAMVAFENKYLKNKFYFEGRDVHIKISPTDYIYLESYNNHILTGYSFTLEKIEDGLLKSKLKASRIVWNNEKNKWTLEDYQIRNFSGMGKQKILSGNLLDTLIDLKPSDFESKYMHQEILNFSELNDYINTLKERGAENIEMYEIEKYERYAYPFAVIILTIFGVIVSAKKSRGGTGFQIAFGFILAFVYLIFVILSRSFATSGVISSMMAAWTPNILFSIIGLLMYKFMPR